MRKINCAHRRSVKMLDSGKNCVFEAKIVILKMRKMTTFASKIQFLGGFITQGPNGAGREDNALFEMQKMTIFASKTQFSLNQAQGSIFTLRRYAQSIPRIILPLKMIFLENFFLGLDHKCHHL
jgi:hypothetical protein